MKSKVKIAIIVSLSTLTLFAYQNCADLLGDSAHGTYTGPTEQDLRYEAIKAEARNILQNRCASCHNPAAVPANSIPDILDQAFLEAQGYVVLGSPQSSILYLDIIDGIEPRDGSELSQNEKDTLRDWILGPEFYLDDLSVGGVPTGTAPTAATFTNVRNRIINPACISCHGAGDPRGSLADYNSVLDYVAPGNAANSTLWREVESNDMPQGRAPLTGELKSLLQRWINDGAPNN